MNWEQKIAFEAFQEGKNVFLTGPAGTGKSFTLAKIVEYGRQNGREFGVTSSTGTSAITIGGRTIHSFLGIGLAKKDARSLALYTRSKKQHILTKIKKLNFLILDEISMISAELLDKIDEYLKILRHSPLPFGNIQVILCGDFYQLPPVGGEYCFKSRAWQQANLHIIHLQTLVRQEGDTEFQRILTEARNGILSDASVARIKAKSSENVFGEIEPTILYSKNVDVDSINNAKYDELVKDLIRKNGGKPLGKDKERCYYTTFSSDSAKTWAETLRIQSFIHLCIGCQVMLTVNLNTDLGLANGTRGVITSLTDEGPVICLKDGCQYLIQPYVLEYEGTDGNEEENESAKAEAKKEAYVTMIPLRLAYALTIHKSQSATLDAVVASLGCEIFEYGQAYTALSRVRDISSLKVTDILANSFVTHPDVVEFYKTF